MTTPAAVPGPVDQDLVLVRVGRMLTDPATIPPTAAKLLPEDLPAPLALVCTSLLALYAAGQ